MSSQITISVETVTVTAGPQPGNWTITNLGPITTPWTAPGSCYQTTTLGSQLPAFYIYDFFAGDDWNCMPPIVGSTTAAGSSTTPSFPGWINEKNVLYYSPATCSGGWRTAATTNIEPSSKNLTACCPIFFLYGVNGDCSSQVPSAGFTMTNVIHATDRGKAGETPVFSTVLGTTNLAVAYPIYIMEASSTPTSSTTSTSSSATSPSTSPGSSVGTAHNASNTLSGGAKAGIAVGVVMFVLLSVLITFFFFRRRGQQQQKKNEPDDPDPEPSPHELITNSNRHELITNANVHEMQQEKATQGVMTMAETSSGAGNDHGDFENFMRDSQLAELDAQEREPSSSSSAPDTARKQPSPFELASASYAPLTTFTSHKDQLSPLSESEEAASAAEQNVDVEKDEEKMRILQERMERIRAEKQRLEKIQELEALEEETKKAILDAEKQRDARASGSGSTS
ncbi:hypothetical protein EG329_014454 [Mollisiaceae sp. DMI_Dod_QoI]|nr:hypothetical protein EG329_014454 [Helotiales sp. DMI_Dod_QoI]